MTLGPDRQTVSGWIRSEVAAGRVPCIRGGEQKTDDPPKVEDKADESKTEDKAKTEPPKDDSKKAKAKTVEIEGQVFVLQEDVNALVGEARQDGKTAGKREVEDELKTRQLSEQGNFKELYEKEAGKVADLTRQVEELTLAGLKRDIGAKHKLSQKLIDRLKGSNEAELEADAKDLAKEFGANGEEEEKKKEVKKPVRTEAGSGSYRRTTAADTTKKPDDESKRRQRNFGFVQQGDVNRWGE